LKGLTRAKNAKCQNQGRTRELDGPKKAYSYLQMQSCLADESGSEVCVNSPVAFRGPKSKNRHGESMLDDTDVSG